MSPRTFVVVSGPPASGKSTLAAPLADALGLPLLAKDVVKDALFSVLPASDVEASRQLGRAAVATLFALAPLAPTGAVLESNFHRSLAAPRIRALPGEVVEVFCRCDRATAQRRYAKRAGTRHAGHFDSARSADELWNDDVAEPVAGGWPVLEADTTRPVDLAVIVAFVRAQVGP